MAKNSIPKYKIDSIRREIQPLSNPIWSAFQNINDIVPAIDNDRQSSLCSQFSYKCTGVCNQFLTFFSLFFFPASFSRNLNLNPSLYYDPGFRNSNSSSIQDQGKSFEPLKKSKVCSEIRPLT